MTRAELLDAINAKKQQVMDLVNADQLEEAKTAKAELQQMQDKFDLLEGMEAAEDNSKIENQEATEMGEMKDSIHEFANAVRSRFQNIATEGTAADGGYTVPDDIQTRINTWKEAHFSLVNLIDVEGVSTDSGARTYQKKAQHTGFLTVEEAKAIGAKATPQFERIEYSIKKYGGYLPVTNELLEDSDANITDVMVKWLGEECIATDNAHILEVLKAFAKTGAIASLDAIKDVINVTIGSAYAGSVAIVTNDSGLNWLDKLKDGNGRDLLKPVVDTTSPFKMQIAVGAHVIPVVAVPNEVLANDGTDAPMFIGSLKDAVKKFDRKKLSILNSNVAVAGDLNAFEQDLTLFRGIMRADYKRLDPDAVFYGKVALGG